MKKVLVIAIALTFVMAAVASAGMNPAWKVAVHVKAHGTVCKSLPAFPTCSTINFWWGDSLSETPGEIDVIPCFFNMVNFTVLEFGLSWPTDWGSTSWFRCKGILAIGNIVNSGDGTTISYGECQTGVTHTTPGYAYLIPTTAGLILPVPHPLSGKLIVVDCTPSPGPYADPPQCVFAGGYLMPGDEPCQPTGIEESTWGSIKSMFE
jgi:hypothetical protein